MNAFTQYPDQVESLITYVKSNNIDISTQEKFTEAMKGWYRMQAYLSKKISEEPIQSIIGKLNLK